MNDETPVAAAAGDALGGTPTGTASVLALKTLEYQKLKEEQLKRIGFRDRLIEVNLFTVGIVAAWALTNKSPSALLVIPWICTVLGWAYLFNDDKISYLGKYIREVLAEDLARAVGAPTHTLFQGNRITLGNTCRFVK